jgi:hypothetical protein
VCAPTAELSIACSDLGYRGEEQLVSQQLRGPLVDSLHSDQLSGDGMLPPGPQGGDRDRKSWEAQ